MRPALSSTPRPVSAAEPGQSRPKWHRMVGLGLPLLFLGWLLLCLFSLLWIDRHAPVTNQDVLWSSRLLLVPGLDAMAWPLAVAVMALALLGGVVNRTVYPVLFGLCGALMIVEGQMAQSMLQLGVMDGSVRIGCYVYESRECLQQLGLPPGSAPPRRGAGGARPGAEASWYRVALREFLEQQPLSMPALFVFSPYYALHVDRIQAILQRQRREVTVFREKYLARAQTVTGAAGSGEVGTASAGS